MFHANDRVKKYNMSIELSRISVFLYSVSFCQVGSDYWGWGWGGGIVCYFTAKEHREINVVE